MEYNCQDRWEFWGGAREGKGSEMGPQVTTRLGRLQRSYFRSIKYVPTSLKNRRRYFGQRTKWGLGWWAYLFVSVKTHVQLHCVPRHIISPYWFLWLFPLHSKWSVNILWAICSISWNRLLMGVFMGSWICFCSQCFHLLYGGIFWKRFLTHPIVGYQSNFVLLLKKFDCDQQYLCTWNITWVWKEPHLTFCGIFSILVRQCRTSKWFSVFLEKLVDTNLHQCAYQIIQSHSSNM